VNVVDGEKLINFSLLWQLSYSTNKMQYFYILLNQQLTAQQRCAVIYYRWPHQNIYTSKKQPKTLLYL